VVPLQVADLVAWESTRDAIEIAPRREFMRIRALGRFGRGNPPTMFAGWGRPPYEIFEIWARLQEDDSE
jgi:hypothetical protein